MTIIVLLLEKRLPARNGRINEVTKERVRLRYIFFNSDLLLSTNTTGGNRVTEGFVYFRHQFKHFATS